MPFHVTHPQTGHTQARSNSAPQRRTHHQRANETGPRSIRHTIDIAAREATLSQHLINQRQGFAHVIAACQLGHHPPVLGVDVDLRIQRISQ